MKAFTMHVVKESSKINSNIKDKKLPESLNAIPTRYLWDVAEYKKPTFVRWTENQMNCFSGWWDLRPRWEFLSILILSELLISLFSSSVHRIWSFLPLRWSILYLMRKWHRVLLPCFKKFIETRTLQMQGLALWRIWKCPYCDSSSAGWLAIRGPMTRSHWARTAIQDVGQKKASRWEQR